MDDTQERKRRRKSYPAAATFRLTERDRLLLSELASRECGGNESDMVRSLVRRRAEELGINQLGAT